MSEARIREVIEKLRLAAGAHDDGVLELDETIELIEGLGEPTCQGGTPSEARIIEVLEQLRKRTELPDDFEAGAFSDAFNIVKTLLERPTGGMDALRHPDCRYCTEYERIIRGKVAEIEQLKRKLRELEHGGGVPTEQALPTRYRCPHGVWLTLACGVCNDAEVIGPPEGCRCRSHFEHNGWHADGCPLADG